MAAAISEMVVVEMVYPLPKTAGVALGEVGPARADRFRREAEERRSGADSIPRAIVISIRRLVRL
jgi:hypothetical protein